MKKALTILLLLITFFSYCQNTYQPGYFINNNGIKTECFIKDLGWKSNPSGFQYKNTETGDVLKADIQEAAEFSIPNYTFIRATVKIDRSGTELDNMSLKKEPEFKTETLYLKVLVTGKATLYHYVDGNLTRFFYSTGSEIPQQLVYKEYKLDDGSIQAAKNKLYKQQLYNIMKDVLPAASRYENLDYEKGDLIKLFIEYGGTTNEKVKDKNSAQNRAIYSIKITPGINFASMALSRTQDGNELKLDTKAAYRLGAEFEVVLPVNNHKWSIFTDPNFSSYKSSGTQNYYSNMANKSNTWAAEYKYIEIPVGIRHYMYLNKDAKFFIDAAYVADFTMSSSVVNFDYKNSTSGYSARLNVTNTYNMAIGGGFSYGRYSAEVRYNFNRDILNYYIEYGSKYSSVSFILGYKIL